MQVAALRGQRRQRVDELLDVVQFSGAGVRGSARLRGLRLGQRLVGCAADACDLLELVEDDSPVARDLVQQRRQRRRLGVAEPVVARRQARVLAATRSLVALRGDVARARSARPRSTGSEMPRTSSALPILPRKPVPGRARGGVLVARERRLPDLHRVDARRLVAVGAEHHHAAVGEAASSRGANIGVCSSSRIRL